MTIDDLIYDPATHTTTTKDGRDVPHVTRIIRATNCSHDFRFVDPVTLAAAQLRGEYVHRACQMLDEDDLNWATLDPRIEGYVRAWEACKHEQHLVVEASEVRVFSEQAWFTGTLDKVCRRDGGVRWTVIVDLKTGPEKYSGAKLQLAAYVRAWLEMMTGPRPTEMIERLAVELYEDGRYRPVWHKNSQDYGDFLHLRHTYRIQQELWGGN
ncbi:MAG: PD-(D/E)XK nuclease family protein [Planctomycetota bacterium]